MLGVHYPGSPYPAEAFGEVAGAGGIPVCCSVAPPARGVLGSIFTISTETGIGPLTLEAYRYCSSNPADLGTPELQMFVSGVPAGGTLVVDSAKHEITLTAPDPDTGDDVVTDGTPLVLQTARALEWLEVRDCDDITCLCARAVLPFGLGAVASVTIETQAREG